MQVDSIPLMSMLKDQMAWLSRRQDVLSQNIASSDVPGYTPHDLKPVDFESALKSTQQSAKSSLAVTDPRHIAFTSVTTGYEETNAPDTAATPTGNSVSLEAEMMKVAETQGQYQAATNLYAKAIEMMKTAIGRGGS
jgi:flagellar basal-body rod protein FlgB